MTTVSKAQKLVDAATDAAQVRAHQTDPNVVALRVERIRAWVDRLTWTGLIAGLAFTAGNVHDFAAGTAPAWSTAWVIAWFLDPMVSLVLLGLLLGESVTSRHKIHTGPWVRVAKWSTLAATYAMNTWGAWAAGDPARVLLHSVPPLLVFVTAEAITDLRERITDAVIRAYTAALVVTAPTVHEPAPAPFVNAPVTAFVNAPVTAFVNAPAAVHEHADDTVHEYADDTVHEQSDTGAEQPEAAFVNATVNASVNAPADLTPAVHEQPANTVHERPTLHLVDNADTVHETPAPTVHERPARPVRARRPARSPKPARKVLADYVNDARQHLTDNTVITPAWVREVTDCSRGLSSKVAATLTTEGAQR